MEFNNQQDTTPKPLNTLISSSQSSDLQVKAQISNNLGNTTLSFVLPMHDFYRMSDVANERPEREGEPIAQRKLDSKHANKLASFILKGIVSAAIKDFENKGAKAPGVYHKIQKMIGEQPYMALQPLVANLRSAGKNGCNLRALEITTNENENVGIRLWLSQKDILYIVDGQHRRKGIQLLIDFLEEIRQEHKYPPKNNQLFPHNRDDRVVPEDEMELWIHCYEIIRSSCKVALEVHLGLDIIEERQLFHDLNNLAKKVEKSLVLDFDSSNPINAFIKDELIENGLIKVSLRDITDWHQDDGSITRKDIVAINAHLLINDTNITSATPVKVNPRLDIAREFWDRVSQLPSFGDESAKTKTLLAQSVMLKALAKLTYDFAFGRPKNEEDLNLLFEGLELIDFSHDNPVWRYYQLTEEEIINYNLGSLKDYLPDSSKGNRDIGQFEVQTNWMRLGSRHNDIFPILGDMIRWQLGLPSRHKKLEI